MPPARFHALASARTPRGASPPSECARDSRAVSCAHTSATSAPTAGLGAPRRDRSSGDLRAGLAFSGRALAARFLRDHALRRDHQLGEKLPGVRDRLGRHLLRRALIKRPPPRPAPLPYTAHYP